MKMARCAPYASMVALHGPWQKSAVSLEPRAAPMSDLTHYEKTVAERIRLVAEYDPPDMAGVAGLLELTQADAADFVAAHAEAIDATAERMALKGELLVPKARKLAQKLLDC